VVDINTSFTLWLMPDAENKPREPTITSVKEVFLMMEAKKKKVWICLTENANGSFTGYLSSVIDKKRSMSKILLPAPQCRCSGGSGDEDV
jgi:hypothetical protein